MKGEIEVVKPGLFSTIQDGGRHGFLNFGVPMSGPMDIYAARLSNLILNNSPDKPVLEITQTGPILKFRNFAQIAITGGNFSTAINGDEIRNDRKYSIKPGDTISFGKRKSGTRAYFSIEGGFKCENVLGSYSWYEGLTSHFRLEKGMLLYFEKGSQKDIQTSSGVRFKDDYLTEVNVPAYPGPEFYLLPVDLQKELFQKIFSVDAVNNRMAIQLKEEFVNILGPIITEPVIPGTVQLTPSGKIIILMRDCQTTGGYPRVLQVSSYGLNILAQKATGDLMRFNLLASIK